MSLALGHSSLFLNYLALCGAAAQCRGQVLQASVPLRMRGSVASGDSRQSTGMCVAVRGCKLPQHPVIAERIVMIPNRRNASEAVFPRVIRS